MISRSASVTLIFLAPWIFRRSKVQSNTAVEVAKHQKQTAIPQLRATETETADYVFSSVSRSPYCDDDCKFEFTGDVIHLDFHSSTPGK